GTFILVDIVILSIMIIGFLINIATINSTATTKAQELLLRTKKHILNETSSRTMVEKNADVIYLSAMAEQLAANRDLYSIAIFGFIVDNALVSRVAIILITQAFAALAAFVKKDMKSD